MKGSRFWDRLAKSYAAKPVEDEESYQHKLQKTRELLTAESHLLEIGCGTGSTALVHAPHVKHITALDFSEKMLAIARDKAESDGIRNVEFVHGDLLDLSTETDSMDVALALSVLHLVKDRGPVYARIRDILKPGGAFVTSTVCIKEIAPALKLVAPLGRLLGLLPTLSIISREELKAEVREAGFSIEYEFVPQGSPGVCFLILRN